MDCFVYDDTFEGVLTSVFEAYYSNNKPDRILSCKNLQMNIIDSYRNIETDLEKAGKVENAIKEKISIQALQNCYCIYLYDSYNEPGTLIYEYIKMGFKKGKGVDFLLQDQYVRLVIDLRRKVLGENHRMTGLLRFVQLEEKIFYSEYSPDSNITCLLMEHFVDRLGDQAFIIHDVKRKLCGIYNLKEWFITDEIPCIPKEQTEKEKLFSELWKKYFITIAIKERENPRLQKQFMPRRYWSYLTEIKQ